jgi:hypothetical protein
VSFKELK